MQLKLYQIDAFAERPFEGNPAAVVPLEQWLPDSLMQSIAMENQLSETAFYVPDAQGDGFGIRWFTPESEMDLCGHATLASAWLVLNRQRPGQTSVTFGSRSGPLVVTKDGDWFVLDFPRRPAVPAPEHLPALGRALGVEPTEVLSSRDLVAVLDNEAQVRALRPDFGLIAALPSFGVLATAKGDSADFVSRCFFPRDGIPEDPVTGSAHSTLIPYWAVRLNKSDLQALQLSKRGGRLRCKDLGDRVHIAGKAVKVLEGVMDV
jgi:PhzF family phenazine biosynthesis protein